MLSFDLALALAATVLALALRPWRAVTDLPWPALALWAALPLLWSVDRLSAMPVMQPLAGSCLLLMMLGWPLAVLSLVPIAALGAWLGGIAWPQALDHLAWNGIVTATLALAIGLATRRWLPRHPFVFLLGRGFLVTALATVLAGALSALVSPLPPGSELGSILLGHWLMAWGEAFATGMLVAIFVAFKPEWLATWSDARYLTDA